MDTDEFRSWAHRIADWMADYYETLEERPVKSQARPGDIFAHLPERPPLEKEDMERILADVDNIILPGMTHWQSPNFFAYFPANASFPSILAEMITAAMGAQCMIWETSPAATELEERVLDWLKEMIGIPQEWSGVIQDTASTATLAALLCARERATRYGINESGFPGQPILRAYCSIETHSSIEKAVKIAGLGRNNLMKIPVTGDYSMNVTALRAQVENDIKEGLKPCCIVATLGTTGCTAIDPLPEIARICSEYSIWLHIDAAYAGTALLLPEYRWMIEGIGDADSFVFNPHKWMFTNFDCSAYFVKDRESLIRTFEILPEYLKTGTRGKVNDYRDWGIPLGRRFRALKLWFVIRCYGLEGLQELIRGHIGLARWFEQQISNDPDFELMAPRTLSLVCFRYHPPIIENPEMLQKLNEMLLESINSSGKAYLTHTKLGGKYTLRLSVAQTHVQVKHLEHAWELIKQKAREQ